MVAARLQAVGLDRGKAEDAGVCAVVGGAELLGDQEPALAVQLFLERREEHALPHRTYRSAPSISRRECATPTPNHDLG